MKKPGIYILLLHLKRGTTVSFGTRREQLAAGYYAYVGSAMSGLTGRLGRHLGNRKPHWHVDAVLDHATVADIQVVPTDDVTAECRLAQAVRGWPMATPVPGFGATDCRCNTHLYYFRRFPLQALGGEDFLAQASQVFAQLNTDYRNHALDQRDPFQALVKCILSLRTQDPVTDAVADRLFAVLATPKAFVNADPSVIAELIYPVGMYRQKATRLIEIAGRILEAFAGQVPDDIGTLVTLPGVGRKTANLVRSFAFHLPAVCVDTHVHRISNRWGLVRSRTPDETETELRRILPERYWIEINPLLVQHGQQICRPTRPRCSHCNLRPWCRYPQLVDHDQLLRALPGAPGHPSLTLVAPG